MASMNPVYQQIREELVKTDNEIESMRARGSEVGRQLSMAQGALAKMPKDQEEWTKNIRDRNVYQKIYDDLLQKLENAKVSKDLETTSKTSNFRVVDPAIVPSVPSFPDTVKLILMGFALAIAAGAGVPIALELLRNSFRDETEIEQAFSVPVLAMIPSIETDSDAAAAKVRNRKLMRIAAAYLSVVLLLLAEEAVARYLGFRLIRF